MVEVEIRTQSYNEETGEIEWVVPALVRADGNTLDVYGDNDLVPRDPVLSINTGKQVHPTDDAEEWARNLPFAYRSGNPVAVIRHDDAGQDVETPEIAADEPVIPEPPAPEFDEDPEIETVESVHC